MSDWVAIAAVVQALSAVAIVVLTLSLAKATRQYADDTARILGEMEAARVTTGLVVRQQAATRLIEGLRELEGKSPAHWGGEIWNRWRLTYEENSDLLKDSEIKQNLEEFHGVVIDAVNTRPNKDEQIKEIRNRIAEIRRDLNRTRKLEVSPIRDGQKP
jgi:phage-related tail protein